MKKKRFGVTAVALLMAATAAFASCGKDENGKLDGNTDIADVKSETVADDARGKRRSRAKNIRIIRIK